MGLLQYEDGEFYFEEEGFGMMQEMMNALDPDGKLQEKMK